MKVFLIIDGQIIRMAVSSRLLAEKICEGFSYLVLSIVEFEIIGEYHASR